MLNIGDRVVYPMHGAGTVKDIIEREDNGEKKQFFILKNQDHYFQQQIQY